jgi:cell division protein FtsW
MTRLQTFLDPYKDPERDGYHILQSLSAISEGGISGLGLGNGIHKFGYLPEDTTDFIFSIICEELGLFGAIAVATLYISLAILGFCIIKKVSSSFHQLLALGIVVTIGLQASINVLVVTALVPTKGIALPLLSNGGTGWLLTAFCIGLIDAIDRNAKASSTVQHALPTTALV